MRQECHLRNVWLTWLGLPILAIGMWAAEGWLAGVVVLVAGVLAQVIYIRQFPRLSPLLGYGSVKDVGLGSTPEHRRLSRVTLYTASVCPFCPIVKRRLLELQHPLGFDLTEVDVTLQPGLAKKKGFHSVPVIEIDGRYWVGNATSADLAAFLTKRDFRTPASSI